MLSFLDAPALLLVILIFMFGAAFGVFLAALAHAGSHPEGPR
jgi:uncharacterized protein YneF (UPF0154 family)